MVSRGKLIAILKFSGYNNNATIVAYYPIYNYIPLNKKYNGHIFVKSDIGYSLQKMVAYHRKGRCIMLIKGTEDLRVQKTIEAIQENFKDLICEKEYDDITVTELCQRARINKKTFYRYYETLDALLLEFQQTMSSSFIEKIKTYKIPEDLDKITREFFLYSANGGKVYEKITCNGSYEAIRNQMIAKTSAHTQKQSTSLRKLPENQQRILLSYVHAATLEIYRQWVADGKKIALNDIIDLAICLVCTGVNGFTAKLAGK